MSRRPLNWRLKSRLFSMTAILPGNQTGPLGLFAGGEGAEGEESSEDNARLLSIKIFSIAQ